MGSYSVRDLTKVPLILAGPILRKVTANSVTVWLALKQNATVTLDVYGMDGTKLLTGNLATTPIGANLHIVAVTAAPLAGPLTENLLYYYDLNFKSASSSLSMNFSQALSSTSRTVAVSDVLTYGTVYPTFVLPPQDVTRLKLIHGSCRKPHGEGYDALSILDTLISQNAASPLDRPHQLLLTGDQIYADDVADVMLLMLSDASNALLGWTEFFKAADGTSVPLGNWPSYERLLALTAAQFTSEDLKSHLLSLGEYFSMYLFVWSDVLWPDTLPTYDDVSTWVTKKVTSQSASAVASLVKKGKSTIQDEIKYVTYFRSTVSTVRKALANIPSYMICDDHEVTDDWNMTRRFCERIYGTPLGMRVVQNALVAFSICQAWGNTPERFLPGTAGAALLANLAAVNPPIQATQATQYDALSESFQKVVGIHDAATVVSGGRVFHDSDTASLRFDYCIEGKGHVILVTDTRTWRAYPTPGEDDHADFLESNRKDSQLAQQLKLPSPLQGRLLLVVLTTNAPPIASFRYAARHPLLIDAAKHPGDYTKKTVENAVVTGLGGPAAYTAYQLLDSAKSPGKLTGEARAIYEEDLFDSWEFAFEKTPSPPFDSLVVQLSQLLGSAAGQHVVLLSGDVHSAFASRLTLRITKAYDGTGAGAGDTDFKPSVTGRMVVAQLVASSFKNTKAETRGQQLEGYTYAPTWYARIPIPPFVPEYAAGPTLAGDISPSDYRLDYLVSNPTLTKAPDPLHISVDDGVANDVANLRNYRTSLDTGLWIHYKGASPLQIIGHNNIAELKFSGSPVTTASHIVHWLGPDGSPYANSYSVSLDPNDATYLTSP